MIIYQLRLCWRPLFLCVIHTVYTHCVLRPKVNRNGCWYDPTMSEISRVQTIWASNLRRPGRCDRLCVHRLPNHIVRLVAGWFTEESSLKMHLSRLHLVTRFLFSSLPYLLPTWRSPASLHQSEVCIHPAIWPAILFVWQILFCKWQNCVHMLNWP